MRIRFLDTTDGQFKDFDVNNIDIIADDGRDLYSIVGSKSGIIDIDANITAKHDGEMLDTALLVSPVSRNRIQIERKKYKP